MKILMDEISKFGIADRLTIHPRAMIIQGKHKEEEGRRLGHISSTQKGCGAAQADKIMRDADVVLARDIPELQPFLGQTERIVNQIIDKGGKVMVEGSQGFDLDINYGVDYPYTTSRQTHVGQVIADCGIPVQEVDNVVAVIRCHPIRVGNQFDSNGKQVGWSGPMGGRELTRDEVTKMSGSPTPLLERTTVTQKIRRIFEMDFERLAYMCMINRPTQLALNFVNYIDDRDYGVKDYNQLSQKTKDFITKCEEYTGVPVTLIGTGPRDNEIIDLRKYKVEV
jgi:adenylosuccinate synthase